MWVTGCGFRENNQGCDRDPAYYVELADCFACREEGMPRCTGHRACVTHAAEARADEFLFLSDQDIVVSRIRDLAIAPACALDEEVSAR